MFGLPILEVAISVIFVYLLLSLICTASNELIAGLFKSRGTTLKKGIKNLLDDSKFPDLVEKLYNHPLINALYEKVVPFRLSKVPVLKGCFQKIPSYIPSRLFALALLDIIAPANPNNPKEMKDVRAAIGELDKDSEVRRALLVLMDEAGNSIQKLSEKIENWYNDAIDRVSGWYARKTQLWTFLVALGITSGLNVDTVQITNSLFRDSTLRSLLVAAAEETVKQSFTQPSTEETAKQSPSNGSKSSYNIMMENLNKIQELGLPIGWNWVKGKADPGDLPPDSLAWLKKVFGLLITTVASSLGAPFWFDILSKIVRVRASGKLPEEKSTK